VLLAQEAVVLGVYRGLARRLRRYRLVRVFLSMLAAVAVHSLLFTTACFVTHEGYREIFCSALMSKALAAALFAPLLTGYLRLMNSDRLNAPLWQTRPAVTGASTRR
jgi:hypothetical protein